MLQPKRTSFRKMHKGRVSGTKKHTLHFGSFGLQACSAGRLKASVIEAMRRVMTRKLKRQGQIWIRVFPDIAVSEKPAEVRMGKGKGNPKFWISLIPAGQILFEFSGISINLAKQATALVSRKIGLKVAFTSE
jgi:large subunit ribosomal protein L16